MGIPQIVLLCVQVCALGVCTYSAGRTKDASDAVGVFIGMVGLNAILYWGGWFQCT